MSTWIRGSSTDGTGVTGCPLSRGMTTRSELAIIFGGHVILPPATKNPVEFSKMNVGQMAPAIVVPQIMRRKHARDQAEIFQRPFDLHDLPHRRGAHPRGGADRAGARDPYCDREKSFALLRRGELRRRRPI